MGLNFRAAFAEHSGNSSGDSGGKFLGSVRKHSDNSSDDMLSDFVGTGEENKISF